MTGVVGVVDGAPGRRSILRYATALGGTALGLAILPGADAAPGSRRVRVPDSLPDPRRPAGTPAEAMPFDHVVIVMMENHSFDNILGALPRLGRTAVDGLRFSRSGTALNSNPGLGGSRVRAFPFPSTEQGVHVSQTWTMTHRQINGGRMNGFVTATGSTQPMGYWTPDVIPFVYSLARTFTVANRWFGSAPCQTFPNRRFLMAATAYGNIATSAGSLKDPPPPNGTIFDRLHSHGVSWRNYSTDVPTTSIIPSVLKAYPKNHLPIARFHADCAAGRLPAVSFVDPMFSIVGEVGERLAGVPGLHRLGAKLSTRGGSEESPQDLRFGERWAYGVLTSVLRSPGWPRTLLVYLYDEHGGYYDHVPPPPAIAPDAIPPRLDDGDVPGRYTIYGPRVPAIVVSPYSRPGGVSNVVYDHTSLLATIEAKWNLPAMTYRDANAATVLGCLDLRRPALLEPPALAPPGSASLL